MPDFPQATRLALALLIAVSEDATPPHESVATGSVAGRVLWGTAPTAHANVNLRGTRIGAACDSLGRFLIRNVSPRAYEVRALIPGYWAATDSVIVRSGETTFVELRLVSTLVVGPGDFVMPDTLRIESLRDAVPIHAVRLSGFYGERSGRSTEKLVFGWEVAQRRTPPSADWSNRFLDLLLRRETWNQGEPLGVRKMCEFVPNFGALYSTLDGPSAVLVCTVCDNVLLRGPNDYRARGDADAVWRELSDLALEAFPGDSLLLLRRREHEERAGRTGQ